MNRSADHLQVNFEAQYEHSRLANYKQLQAAFNAAGLDKVGHILAAAATAKRMSIRHRASLSSLNCLAGGGGTAAGEVTCGAAAAPHLVA